MSSVQQLVERRERLLGPGNPLFYDDPVHLVKGEGVWLHGAGGEKYLDCYNNVPCVGHCHPRVVDAMHRQAATLNLHSRYLHDGVLEYSERLLALHAGRVVTYIEIDEALWRDAKVEPQQISAHKRSIVRSLTGAVGAETARRLVETIPRRGLRLNLPPEHIRWKQ